MRTDLQSQVQPPMQTQVPQIVMQREHIYLRVFKNTNNNCWHHHMSEFSLCRNFFLDKKVQNGHGNEHIKDNIME